MTFIKKFNRCNCILWFCLISFVCFAEQEPDATHTLNLKDTDIRLLVETVSEITGKNFVLDPEVSGKITVISGQAIAEDKVYDLFLSILNVNGFTTENVGDTIKIIPMAKSNPLATATAEHPEQMTTKIFRIQHIPVDEVVQVLKNMNNRLRVISNKDSNLLIVSDKAANLDKIAKLIASLDKKSDASIELISLQYANAEDIAETLSGLLEDGNNLGPKSKVVPDNRTNSIIVNANPSLKNKIMGIVRQLDVPLATNTQSQVIYLKYASAEKMVPILETLAKRGQDEKAKAADNTSIQAHQETNSLVINAPPAVYRNIISAIEQLDVRRQQVLIEAIIAEVSIDNSKELGVDWYAPIAGDSDDGLVGGSFTGNGTPNISSDNPLEVFGGIISSGLNLGYLNYGTDSSGNRVFKFGGLLRALGTNDDNNVLSTPSVVTLNHQEASLSVGQEVPFITGQYSQTGTASSGSSNPFTTIQREDVGLSLKVTPHINEGGQIVVDIAQEISSIDPNTKTAVDLVTKKRTLETSVMIPDNNVLVLGGLIDDEVQESIKKVPLLGDVPLLKNLFRTKKRTRVKRNLMIFIHPQILKDDQHQQQISKQKYDDIRRQQMEKVKPEKFRRGEPLLPEMDTDEKQKQD